ncbi:MAG: hypothetical protein FWF29_10605, partial [Treponema sp.]|nr:hypothetical protein [Treponema sp.]
SMLGDQKLLWTFEETEHSKNPVPASLRIYKMGKLLPMSELYAIQRKDLLTDAKYRLPFWYSFPVISAIAGFFHRLTGKKRKKTASESMLIEETPESKVKTIKELHRIAETIQSALIPPGRSLEMYMDELENKWNKIIEAGSRKNLTVDVQALVRDHLRKMIRIHRTKRISRTSIHESASRIISGTPALHNMSSQDSLCRYIELYMTQLLLNIK